MLYTIHLEEQFFSDLICKALSSKAKKWILPRSKLLRSRILHWIFLLHNCKSLPLHHRHSGWYSLSARSFTMGNCFRTENVTLPVSPRNSLVENLLSEVDQKLGRHSFVKQIDVCKCGRSGREFFISHNSPVESYSRYFYCSKWGETWSAGADSEIV